MSFAVDGGDAVSFSKCLDVLAGWGAGGRGGACIPGT